MLLKLSKINTFHIGLFAYYLDRLRSTPDGDDYPGGLVIISTTRLDRLHVLGRGEQDMLSSRPAPQATPAPSAPSSTGSSAEDRNSSRFSG